MEWFQEYVRRKGWDGAILRGVNSAGNKVYEAFSKEELERDLSYKKEHPDWDGCKIDDGGYRCFVVNERTREIYNIKPEDFYENHTAFEYLDGLPEMSIEEKLDKCQKKLAELSAAE